MGETWEYDVTVTQVADGTFAAACPALGIEDVRGVTADDAVEQIAELIAEKLARIPLDA